MRCLLISDQFYARHRGVVALAWPELEDAQVSTVAVLVAWGDLVDELVGHLFVAQVALHLADAVHPHGALVVRLLGLGDELLGDRSKCLGLGFGRGDALGGDQRRSEVGHHQLLVLRAAAEVASSTWCCRHGRVSVASSISRAASSRARRASA